MKSRSLVPEKMDDPGLDPAEHRRALRGLRRINWISRTGHQLSKEILTIANERKLTQVSVLDVGCGSGDLAINVATKLSRHLTSNVEGWDISPTAIESARQSLSKSSSQIKASKTHPIEVQFSQADALQPSQDKHFDFVYCSLFLHHFTEQQAIEILLKMAKIATVSVIVDDLSRSRLGLVLAQVGCYALTRSPVVRFDGPQSVRAAFTRPELLQLAHTAGMSSASIRTHWPERFLLRWDLPR